MCIWLQYVFLFIWGSWLRLCAWVCSWLWYKYEVSLCFRSVCVLGERVCVVCVCVYLCVLHLNDNIWLTEFCHMRLNSWQEWLAHFTSTQTQFVSFPNRLRMAVQNVFYWFNPWSVFSLQVFVAAKFSVLWIWYFL